MRLFETLEARQMMTAVTDMTQLALEYPQHKGTTNLYLNFDGGNISDSQAGHERDVLPFVPQKSKDRSQAIQDILYRASEIFAPFNVRVSVLSGFGQFAKNDGATTLFIGDQPTFVDSGGRNLARSDAPSASCDMPDLPKGKTHAPNSDDYDLAFIDPVNYDGTGNNTTETDLGIARDIAHEAGHTLGLGHVLSAPTNDVMSYNAANQYFANTTLPLTDLNNIDGTNVSDPNCIPTTPTGPMQTQNSFTYLDATIGARNLSSDVYPSSVADTTAVDPSYLPSLGTTASITASSKPAGTLNQGDYDVYNFSLKTTRLTGIVAASKYAINVSAIGLSPEVMVYDSTGTNLVTSFTGTSGQFTPAANTSYKIVIGSADDNSSGSYALSFAPVSQATQTPVATASPAKTTSIFSAAPISIDLLQLVS